MDLEHRQPATPTLSVRPAQVRTARTEAGPAPVELEEDLWLEREREYAELGGEG
jgi:hypothetical protein